jgi:BirA family biotin operon repressor/biotin-[acetyl-CoA-carboxylase] ligase
VRWHRHDLAACGSTNDEAIARARAGAPSGTVVVADEQGAGRGRLARAWSSTRGDLMASVIVRPPPGAGLAVAAGLPLAIGVAAATALRGTGAPAVLKWPNDVGVVAADGSFRKLGGILVEGVGTGADAALVVGIGVNLVGGVAARAPELAPIATSIEDLLGRRPERDAVLAALLGELAAELPVFFELGLESVRARWHDLMAPLARVRHATVDGVIEGEPLGLAGDGALMIRTVDGGVHHVLAGDVVALPRSTP